MRCTLKNHQICQKIWQEMKKSLVRLALNGNSKTRNLAFGYMITSLLYRACPIRRDESTNFTDFFCEKKTAADFAKNQLYMMQTFLYTRNKNNFVTKYVTKKMF